MSILPVLLTISLSLLKLNIDIPAEQPQSGDEESLRKTHHALFEIEVVQGDLICPETGRKFPIKQGIPNMLLNEDEV